jgi:hypothetical protein
MKKTLIFALLAMIYVPGAMHTYRGSNVGGGYRFIFDQNHTSVAFFQLLVNQTTLERHSLTTMNKCPALWP